ncbi:C3a anaphylatoxin chemotactic receptor-like [Hypanus sabinus]|uniref:C3a anaphylatoxin chemotactic receptor-like n=1 Tax=Hypanus sabinus TaxID=79690 RepID=UPI0028C3A904|nr:C3a anaphylatoxin chemotactic receptor-like [Hypanus sabinus]
MSLSEGVYNSTITANLNHSNFIIDRDRKEWGEPFVMSMVIFILTVLLGVPGNGAVIWASGFKMKRTVHTVCYLNLAAADLMYCLSLPSRMVDIVLHSEDADNFPSEFFASIMFLNGFASIYLLCLISIYRCLAITRPIWFRQHVSLAWVRATCFVVWVISVMCLPVFIIRNLFKTRLVLAALGFGPPFLIMITCYAVVGWRLQGDRFPKSRNPIRLIMIAVAAFVICWLPFCLCALLLIGIILSDWYRFTQALTSFNSAVNPLVYVFAGSNFRQVFKRSLLASLQQAFTEQELQGETPNRNPTSDRNV